MWVKPISTGFPRLFAFLNVYNFEVIPALVCPMLIFPAPRVAKLPLNKGLTKTEVNWPEILIRGEKKIEWEKKVMEGTF